jgi:hypothetical protein
MRAAALAIQFETPKLGVTGHFSDTGIAERLERAIARSGELRLNQIIDVTPNSDPEE